MIDFFNAKIIKNIRLSMVIIVILHQQTQKYNIYQLKSNMAAKQFHRHFPTRGFRSIGFL